MKNKHSNRKYLPTTPGFTFLINLPRTFPPFSFSFFDTLSTKMNIWVCQVNNHETQTKNKHCNRKYQSITPAFTFLINLFRTFHLSCLFFFLFMEEGRATMKMWMREDNYHETQCKLNTMIGNTCPLHLLPPF